MDKPPPPPEAQLLRLVRAASGVQASEAAANMATHFRRKMSASRWSQIENGYETRDGGYKPAIANAATLAQMFYVVGGVTPDRLESEGRRPDAARILREILRQAGDDKDAARAKAYDEELRRAAEEDDDLKEIAELVRLDPELRVAFVRIARSMKAAREAGEGRSQAS